MAHLGLPVLGGVFIVSSGAMILPLYLMLTGVGSNFGKTFGILFLSQGQSETATVRSSTRVLPTRDEGGRKKRTGA